jgi:hypothetical protein
MASLDGLSQMKATLSKLGWDTSQSQARRDDDGSWSFTLRGMSSVGAVAAGTGLP